VCADIILTHEKKLDTMFLPFDQISGDGRGYPVDRLVSVPL
jgi:hypothetical protein